MKLGDGRLAPSMADGAMVSLPPSVEKVLVDIEKKVESMAREASQIVNGFFEKAVQVEYKDEKKSDPVTAADKQSQTFLTEAILQSFPDHGILGEEGTEKEEDSPAPDFLWALDPLDGTTNFLNGLPIYAVSIGVLYRGLPVIGCLYVPWPQKAGGFVLHARRGCGAFIDRERLLLANPEESPTANRLTGVPGSVGAQYRMAKAMRGKVGDIRTTGSCAYELAMVARGVMQYTILGAPRLWDMAGGALIVVEAGGSVMMRRGDIWAPMASLIPTWDTHPPTMKELRRWVGPLVAGNAKAAPFVAANLLRRRPSLVSTVRRWLHRRRRKPPAETDPDKQPATPQ